MLYLACILTLTYLSCLSKHKEYHQLGLTDFSFVPLVVLLDDGLIHYRMLGVVYNVHAIMY